MYALDNESGVAVMPPIKAQKKAPSDPQWFTEGGNGVAPTYPGADWFNITQAELLNVLTDAGITPNKTQLNQLALAIRTLARKEIATIPAASGTVSGILRLTDSINMASSVFGASALAVKTAFDKAVEAKNAADSANNNANNRVSKTGDTVTGTLYLKRGSKSYRINNFDWSLLLEIDSNLDSLIGNNRCAIGFNNNGSLGLGGNAVDGWWAGINKSGLSVAKEITEGLTGKKLSESLPIPWLVGVPLPWMQSAVPAGFLAMQGQAFDKSRYPILAQRYPSGRLPDLRGEFIRGWDNGREVDSRRALLSSQNDSIKSHNHQFKYIGQNQNPKTNRAWLLNQLTVGNYVNNSIPDNPDNMIIKVAEESWIKYKKSPFGDVAIYINNTGEKETRPRNIAFQYICLAA